VTCYVADVESGLIHSKVGKNFYARKKIILPFVLNPPQVKEELQVDEQLQHLFTTKQVVVAQWHHIKVAIEMLQFNSQSG